MEDKTAMKKVPHLIVMLTHNDKTIENPFEIFDACKNSKAKFFGIKDGSLDIGQMKTIFDYMKKHNKTTVLEVVQYNEADCLEYAKIAVECQVDMLIGTCFFDSVNDYCLQHQLKYMPFIGQVHARPSILSGSIEDMMKQAQMYQKKGVYGVDLLGYRYVGDADCLNQEIVSNIDLPVIIAGSIDSYQKLDAMKKISPFAFTIGSAFFDHKFGSNLVEQINLVCDYLNQ